MKRKTTLLNRISGYYLLAFALYVFYKMITANINDDYTDEQLIDEITTFIILISIFLIIKTLEIIKNLNK